LCNTYGSRGKLRVINEGQEGSKKIIKTCKRTS